MTRLERRVRELQTAMVVVIQDLALEHHVAAAERARLDRRSFKDDVPRDRLLTLYSAPPQK